MILTDEMEKDPVGYRETSIARRPFIVTVIAGMVLFFAVIYFLRSYLALSEWVFLENILQISPIYLIVSGILWGILGILLAWSLWNGFRSSPLFALIFMILFSLYYWLDRLFFKSFSGRNSDWLFSASLNLIFIAWIVWIFRRPKVRSFYEGANEQQAENRTPA